MAAFAITHDVSPREIPKRLQLTAKLQLDLLHHGDPIYWFDDLLPNDAAFSAAQLLAAHAIFGPLAGNLHFALNRPMTLGQGASALEWALEEKAVPDKN